MTKQTQTQLTRAQKAQEQAVQRFIGVAKLLRWSYQNPENGKHYLTDYKDRRHPLKKEYFDTSYCDSYLAKCGPRNSSIFLAVKTKWWFETSTVEDRVETITHEIGHLKHIGGRDESGNYKHSSSTHPPAFWDLHLQNLKDLKKHEDELKQVFDVEDINWNSIARKCKSSVHACGSDKRKEDLHERANRMKREIKKLSGDDV